METAKLAISRRGFVAAALSAGVYGASAAAAPRGASGRRLPDVAVAPYFNGGWTMYMFSNRGHAQMLSTLFLSPSGKVVVIDGGMPQDGAFLYGTLMDLGGEVDTWIITHAHLDHYGALGEMLKMPGLGGLKVGRIVHSFLPVEFIAETSKGSLPYVKPFLADLAASGLRVERPKVGEVFDFGEGITFECLNDYDLSMRGNSVNNSSICFRVLNGGKSVFITGDIGVEQADKLVKMHPPEKIRSDVVFLSHHGQCGAPKRFYEAVAPEICVWAAPQWLWDNRDEGGDVGSGSYMTNYTKCWMQEIGVKRQILLVKDAALGPKP